MLTKSTIIGKQILNSPVACLVLRDTTTVNCILVLVVHTRTSEVSALRTAVVQTDVDTIAQTLNPRALQFTEERVVRTNTLVLVQPYFLITLHCLFGNNALVIGRESNITLQVTFFIVWAGQRALAQYAIHIIHTLSLAIAVIGAQAETEILAYHLVEVTANGDTIITFCGNDRLVMIVTCTKAVTTTVGTTSHTHVVIVGYTCLIVQILPVGTCIIIFVK